MPAKVKVRILAGRNLPVMDKSSDASDAFVEVKLGNTTYKTEVYRRSLNPFWNSEWFRFEVSDQELQDEPLQIRIMDYDTYSANDAIGKVYINLNPLLINPGRSMNGWLPIYDTLHGIRGEINCMVKVNLFSDYNRYRHSSCGVRFFFSDIPNGYKCDAILGFVDELLVNDDPEYQWIDKIRTPRASNEARQTLFTKLSGEVQRKLGLKAEIFGGNAVIGYQQSFDLEGGSGIVGRGIGTAVVLSKIGYQFDGIISPIPANSMRQTNQYHLGQNSVDQWTNQNRRPYHMSERHLVHSVSADYFYEVPNLSNSKPPPASLFESKSRGFNSVDLDISDDDPTIDEDDKTSDSSEFQQALDFFEDNLEAECLKDPKIPTASSVNDSSNPISRLIQLSKFNKSFDLSDSSVKVQNNDRNQGSRAKISNLSLIKKIKQSNNIFCNRNDLKPKRLIKFLPFRRNSSYSAQASHNNRKDSDPLDRVDSQAAGSSISDDTTNFPKLVSSSKSMSTSQSASTDVDSELTPSGSQKRRKDKSPGSSLAISGPDQVNQDVLSTIEEKIDDDDHQIDASTRTRVLSCSSVNRNRKMTRAKEIDLSTGQELGDSELGQVTSVCDVGENRMDADRNFSSESSRSSSTSTLDAPHVQSESMLSSSSQSASIPTDVTMKAKKVPTRKACLVSMASTPAGRQRSPGNRLRRAETSLTQDDCNISMGSPNGSRIASSPSAGHLQSPQKSLHQNYGSATNFAQSVRVIKAQQHLLQNMIRNQNQSLLKSSMNKAKNAFMYPNRIHQSEYPFVTLRKFPEGMIQSTGGVVSVHSVKLLDHIINDEESETRDIWWTEIRKEIRSHAKALNCNTILGYTETSKVLGDICVLSASGTAAVMNPYDNQMNRMMANGFVSLISDADRLSPNAVTGGLAQVLKVPVLSASPPPTHSSMPSNYLDRRQASGQSDDGDNNAVNTQESIISDQENSGWPTKADNSMTKLDCSFCHSPLVCVESIGSLPSCTICNSSKVPDVLLLTIEPPANLNIVSAGTLVQARVCRAKRDSHGEVSAKEIGDALPFLEYELHRQLFSKLKFKGLNCLFNLEIDISIGENMITGIATGTGCFVLGLPTPEAPQISAGKGIKASKLNEIQRLIDTSAMKNRENLGLDHIDGQLAEYQANLRKTNKSMVNVNDQRHQSSSTGTLTNQYLEESHHPMSSRTSSFSGAGNFHLETTSATEAEPTRRKSLSKLRSPTIEQLATYAPGSPGHLNHRRNQSKQVHKSKSSHHFYANDHLVPTENLINLMGDDNNIVLEVDDNEDADIIALLIDNEIPEGYLICNSESVPTINQSSIASINMFTQVMRVKLTSTDQFAQQFDLILQSLFVKLRRSLPCCLTNISFVVDLPESHVVQISVTGCLLGLCSSPNQQQQSDSIGNVAGHSGTGLSKFSEGSQANNSLFTTSTNKSTSSSSESISPVSSTGEGTRSQSTSSSSSGKSTPESVKLAGTCPVSERPSSSALETAKSEAKSLVKQLSKGNIAAMLTGRVTNSSNKANITATNAGIELTTVRSTPVDRTDRTSSPTTTTSQLNRLLLSGKSTQTMRAVFKKQQTYPGAISPAISGQDRLLPSTSGANPSTSSVSNSVSTSKAARRATLILNKVVKQPLRDLGSNFNTATQANGSGRPSIGDINPAPVSSTSILGKTKFSSSGASTSSNHQSLLSSQITKSRGQKTIATTGTLFGASIGRETPTLMDSSSVANSHLLPNPFNSMKINSSNRSPINSSIDITSLSYIPGAKEYFYLGNLSFSFVRETNSVRENGGLNGFIHCFLMEVYAIVRAHVSALGGNAFLSFRLQQSCIFYHSNKNQAQCLISVAGDAVQVTL